MRFNVDHTGPYVVDSFNNTRTNCSSVGEAMRMMRRLNETMISHPVEEKVPGFYPIPTTTEEQGKAFIDQVMKPTKLDKE